MSNEAIHKEGCSNTIMEYMACGLPVVCSAGGGNAELVVEGRAGYLIPAGDWRLLCDRLERLTSRPDEASHMGEAGHRRLSEEFTVERMVERLLASTRSSAASAIGLCVTSALLPGRQCDDANGALSEDLPRQLPVLRVERSRALHVRGQGLLESAGHEVIPFSVRYAVNEPSPYEGYFVEPIGRRR